MAISPALFLLGVPTEHTGFLAAGNSPIVFTSSDTQSVNTGDTAVVTVMTSGGTGDIDFEIVGGDGTFTIDAESGALAFVNASVDGTYEVTVRASSVWGSADQEITVTVAAPMGSTVIIDFVTGTYTVDGNAASITDLIGDNPPNTDYENAAFNPSDVVNGTGWVPLADPINDFTVGPIFKGAALDAILAGCTMVVEFVGVNPNDSDISWHPIFVDSPSFTASWAANLESTSSFVSDGTNSDSFTSAIKYVEGVNKTALTVGPAGIAVSVNGSAAERSSTISLSVWSTVAASYFELVAAISAFRSIKIYPPVADGGLPALTAL